MPSTLVTAVMPRGSATAFAAAATGGVACGCATARPPSAQSSAAPVRRRGFIRERVSQGFIGTVSTAITVGTGATRPLQSSV